MAVPRPISSRITRLRGPARLRMPAVSTISTMKVERPRARSSAAPTRENSRSTTPIWAAVAGTKLPIWARTRSARSGAGTCSCRPCWGRSAATASPLWSEVAVVGDEALAGRAPAPARPPDGGRRGSGKRRRRRLLAGSSAARWRVSRAPRTGRARPMPRRGAIATPSAGSTAWRSSSNSSSSRASARSAAVAIRLSSSASSAVL